MGRLWDTYDQIIYGDYVTALPYFIGYDRETREFGCRYFWEDGKWMTNDEVKSAYEKRNGLGLTEEERAEFLRAVSG